MTIEEAEKAVEEARFRLAGELVVAPGSPAYWEALDALIEAVRRQEREPRLLVAHCQDCSWSREADSGRCAEELRMRHEQLHATHNVWISEKRAPSSEEAGG